MTKNEHFMKWKVFAEERAKNLVPEHLVEDATQEAYIGLMKAIGSFNPDQGFKFSTYATHCIRNAVYDFMRKERRQTDNLVYTDKMDDILPSTESSAQAEMERYELNIAIREACGKMTSRESFILGFHLLAENPMTVREIAEEYDCGKSSVQRDIDRLKSRIKENLHW